MKEQERLIEELHEELNKATTYEEEQEIQNDINTATLRLEEMIEKQETKEEFDRLMVIVEDEKQGELYEKISFNYWKMEKHDLKWLLLDFIYNSDEETIRKALKDYNERIRDENGENDNFYELYEQYEKVGLV